MSGGRLGSGRCSRCLRCCRQRNLAEQVRALGQDGVDLGVDAGEKQARDRRDRAQRQATAEPELHTGQVGVQARGVPVEGEQQRHVDADACCGQQLDRVNPGGCPGTLIIALGRSMRA